MANPVPGSSVKCSVCWEEVSDTSGRTVVKLRCSHMFHLDCIGSAFNASGSMQCPNCRKVEIGLWRRFENNSPEESIDEDDNDEDVDDFTELLDDDFCPLDELLIFKFCRSNYLLWLSYQNRIQRQEIFAGDLNFNHFMTGPLLPSEAAALHVLPHHYQRNCSCMFDMPCALHMAVSQISAQEVPSSNMRTVPVNIPQISIAHQAILNPWQGAQSSFRSSIESHSLGYYSSVYRNFEWVQPRRNSPAPAVHNMSAGGTAANGMQGWSLEMNAVPLPEQTSTYSYICPSSGSLQSHPLPVNFHRHRVQDGNIVTPPECLRSDINPFW
ncbi:uncharacterized protein LOC110611268 isoform X2 [Manihot esculenta]|uniref:Uncharacterized protein n=2 Tax=Manihot esculenta TaxID=3983 RepID=A0ACB7I1A4_MANES|nr:uncharacterized protein LOC110611268 isoform X2 [Manihot esculenta]KAG8658832.1 hypothetical protein MANES_03G196300v8 [Manihot esculenta]KAG8658833.1 hypothetical protein MANES_03G196300v8 [Manihot esculenta]